MRLPMTMQLARRAVLVLTLVGSVTPFTGCRNSEEIAVGEVMRFAQRSPYTLSPPTSQYGGYTVVVEDSALDD
jgi:hypothetical protein